MTVANTGNSTTSSSHRVSATDTTSARPMSDGRVRPAEIQSAVDERCRSNPDELVLGFRRHCMNNQRSQLPSVRGPCDRPLAARQVITISVISVLKIIPILISNSVLET